MKKTTTFLSLLLICGALMGQTKMKILGCPSTSTITKSGAMISACPPVAPKTAVVNSCYGPEGWYPELWMRVEFYDGLPVALSCFGGAWKRDEGSTSYMRSHPEIWREPDKPCAPPPPPPEPVKPFECGAGNPLCESSPTAKPCSPDTCKEK